MSKRYLLTYPDGSRRHIDRELRDSLLLSLSAKKTGPEKYLYIGPVRTFHSFADLRELSVTPIVLRRFLGGSFVFELNGKRQHEIMETPDGMAMRLAADG